MARVGTCGISHFYLGNDTKTLITHQLHTFSLYGVRPTIIWPHPCE